MAFLTLTSSEMFSAVDAEPVRSIELGASHYVICMDVLAIDSVQKAASGIGLTEYETLGLLLRSRDSLQWLQPCCTRLAHDSHTTSRGPQQICFLGLCDTNLVG
jgi:hypothetical protein